MAKIESYAENLAYDYGYTIGQIKIILNDIRENMKKYDQSLSQSIDKLDTTIPSSERPWYEAVIRANQITAPLIESINDAVDKMNATRLKAFLLKHRSEIKYMCISDFDTMKEFFVAKYNGYIEGGNKMQLFCIHSLIEKKGLSLEEVMNIFGIPEEEYDVIYDKLEAGDFEDFGYT